VKEWLFSDIRTFLNKEREYQEFYLKIKIFIKCKFERNESAISHINIEIKNVVQIKYITNIEVL
jgi:hypothetical protein